MTTDVIILDLREIIKKMWQWLMSIMMAIARWFRDDEEMVLRIQIQQHDQCKLIQLQGVLK